MSPATYPIILDVAKQLENNNTYSQCFNLARGVRQGEILSPYLFKLYVRDLLKAVVKSCIGCNIAGWFINILAYADDIWYYWPPHGGIYSVY